MIHPLPNRCPCERFRVVHLNIAKQKVETLHITVGFEGAGYDPHNGVFYLLKKPRHVFIEGGKPGTEFHDLCRDSGILISKGLHHDAPIEDIRQAVTRNEDGSSAGPGGTALDAILAAEVK